LSSPLLWMSRPSKAGPQTCEPVSHMEKDALTQLERVAVEIEPAKPYFSADLVHLNGNAVIVLVGDLDMATVVDLERVLEPLVEAGPAELILDFSALTFIDSSGLAVLVTAHNRLTSEGRRLTVRSPRPNATRVLQITGLTDVLHVDVGAEPTS
jgi:anti-sigma B factor antagonist